MGHSNRGAPRCRPPGPAILLGIAILAALWMGVGHPAAAQPPVVEEYAIKAAMLFNFTKFIEWPVGAFADSRSPIIVGIVGADPFRGALEEAFRDKVVNGRPVAVQHYDHVSQATRCHVVYISKSRDEDVRESLATLVKTPAVTVGEGQQFTRMGGVIGFLLQDHKIRFEINIESTERSGVRISSKLLRLATGVRSGPGERTHPNEKPEGSFH